MFEEQAFDPERDDRAGFDCGVPELDDYLRRLATQHRRNGVSSVHVLVDTGAPSLILGYYTLSAAQVDAAELSDADRKKLPRYPVPCFRIGRLACRGDRHGQGVGRLLMGCAVERCLEARKQVGAFALIVDAKSAAAKSFHEHYGFKPCARCVDDDLPPAGIGPMNRFRLRLGWRRTALRTRCVESMPCVFCRCRGDCVDWCVRSHTWPPTFPWTLTSSIARWQ